MTESSVERHRRGDVGTLVVDAETRSAKDYVRSDITTRRPTVRGREGEPGGNRRSASVGEGASRSGCTCAPVLLARLSARSRSRVKASFLRQPERTRHATARDTWTPFWRRTGPCTDRKPKIRPWRLRSGVTPRVYRWPPIAAAAMGPS